MHELVNKKVLEYLSLLTLIYYVFGLCYMCFFYYYFDFSIIPYLTAGDLIFSEFVVFVPVFILTGLLGYRVLKQPPANTQPSIKKIIWIGSIAIVFATLSYIPLIYMRLPYSNIVLTSLYMLSAGLGLRMVVYTKFQSVNVLLATCFMFLTVALLYIARKHEARCLMNGDYQYKVCYKQDGTIHKTDSTYIFIGETSNFLFFYSKKTTYTTVVNRATIDSFSITKFYKQPPFWQTYKF